MTPANYKPFHLEDVAEIYTDGGNILANPSEYGVTWAYTLVDGHNRRVEVVSGVLSRDPNRQLFEEQRDVDGALMSLQLPPAEIVLSNNLGETYAVFEAIERMRRESPEWEGKIVSDSSTAIRRTWNGTGYGTMPTDLFRVGEKFRRWLHKNGIEPEQIDGAHSEKDIVRGTGKSGRRTSDHNLVCDLACKERARYFMNRLEAAKVLEERLDKFQKMIERANQHAIPEPLDPNFWVILPNGQRIGEVNRAVGVYHRQALDCQIALSKAARGAGMSATIETCEKGIKLNLACLEAIYQWRIAYKERERHYQNS